MANEHKGVIYILTNPSFEEYVKIGYAHDLKQRLQQLNRSEALPLAFRAYAIYEVDEELTDKELHKLIEILNPEIRSVEKFNGKKRVREFYIMSREQAYAILECIAKISGTTDRLKYVKPTGEELAEEKLAEEVKKEAKRGKFHFSEVGIKPGEEVVFIDDESIRPIVVDDRHVEYNGQVASLSALARKIKDTPYPLQGTAWFTYNGVKLTDLRDQVESCK